MTKRIESLQWCSQALKEGQISAVTLTETALRMAEQSTSLNAFVSLDEDQVLAQAKASDKRRQQGQVLSDIDGIPLAIKDNYLTQDYPTSACSNAAPLEPNNIDATVVANLRGAGAIIFAKTNMHEWAFGATNSTSTVGASNNPHNENHITGGSSGGSAAAVAAGIVPAALGSDTGGSVRIPASACGVYGFKPTYGRASRFGILPLSWSLDAPGPLTRSIADIESLLPYFLGPDVNDASTKHALPLRELPIMETPKLVNLVGKGLERSDEVDATINAALQNSSADVSQASLSSIHSYFSAWEAILHVDAASYHSELLAANAAGFSSVTRAHLEAGKQLTAVEMLKAQKIRNALKNELSRLFNGKDALILPTLPVVAPKHDEQWQEFGGRRVTTQDSMTWFCWLGNLAGLPCLSIPIGKNDNGLPIGMMIMGRPNQDEKVLAIGQWLDKHIKGE